MNLYSPQHGFYFLLYIHMTDGGEAITEFWLGNNFHAFFNLKKIKDLLLLRNSHTHT